MYAKDLSELKYELSIKNRKDAGRKHFNDPNAFIECSNIMDGVYENIDYHNASRKRKKLFVFEFQAEIIKWRKLNICFVFLTEPYFFFSKRSQIKFDTFLDYENQQQ